MTIGSDTRSAPHKHDFASLAASMFPLRLGRFEDLRYADRDDATITFACQREEALAPLALVFHGGGWARGTPAKNIVLTAPLLLAGWSVANVRYRLGGEATAPAAVEDAIAALDCCFEAASSLGYDVDRIVPFGISAGGHLALCASIAPDLFDRRPRAWCAGAVVNLYGVADPSALLAGDHRQQFAVDWLGGADDLVRLGQSLSPTRLVQSGRACPPVFTAHGLQDDIVPFGQSEQLHAALAARGADQRLLALTGTHGHFAYKERVHMFGEVRKFLEERGLWPTG